MVGRRVTAVVAVVVAVLATACYKDFDFTADHKADHVYVDRITGDWWNAETQALVFDGQPGEDMAVPADWDGDHNVDVAVVRGDSEWVTNTPLGTVTFAAPPAVPGYDASYYRPLPVPGDYDGDGTVEPAWYRSADSTWFIAGRDPIAFGSGPTLPSSPISWATLQTVDSDYPVPADYDGDGATDLSTYNPVTLVWRVRSSATGEVSTVVMGGGLAAPLSYRRPAPADYDGVGHAQRAIVDNRGWLVEGHDSPIAAAPLCDNGRTSDCEIAPAPADYDGDGRAEPSFMDLHTASWHTQAMPTYSLSGGSSPYPPGYVRIALPAGWVQWQQTWRFEAITSLQYDASMRAH